MKEIKWNMSDDYILNFNDGNPDCYYLAKVIFNSGKQEFKIDSDIKGYYLIVLNVEFNPETSGIGKPNTFYSDVRCLVECGRRGEKNFNLALEKMKEVARESIEMMEEDKRYFEYLAKKNDMNVEEVIEKMRFLMNEAEKESENKVIKFEEEKNKRGKKEKKKVTFDDIAGMTEVKDVLLDVIDQLKNPDKYEYFDIEPIRSLLMHGKPGCGKTYIANAFANMIDANFVKVNMGDIASKYQGQTGNNIKKIFDEARASDKFTVLFWDEIDAVANRRGADENSKEKNATLNVLLTEMSSDDNENIFMIFATNFVELLDPAFLRSGRCDIKIQINLPDLETRLQILELNTRKKPLNQNVDLKTIAKMLEGSNCADISLLCNQSARIALKKNKNEINQEDFLEALEKMNGNKKEEFKPKKIGFESQVVVKD